MLGSYLDSLCPRRETLAASGFAARPATTPRFAGSDGEPITRGTLQYRALRAFKNADADKVFTGWMLAGRGALTSPILSHRLRELVVLRIAYLMDSPYELAQHDDITRTAGLDVDEISAVTSDSSWQTDHFEPAELAVLQLTTELMRMRGVAAGLFDQVHAALETEATMEVLMIISRNALALMLNALDVDLDLDETARLPNISQRQEHS
jgi:alkylhydroperoxidase family enzyme